MSDFLVCQDRLLADCVELLKLRMNPAQTLKSYFELYQLIVDVYGTHKGQIPEGQNIKKDLEFVEQTIKRFTDTEKLSIEIDKIGSFLW